MGFKCGIVGLPNVGKSTLFNALTNSTISAENFPFCTVEPNVGIVPVPDPRLNAIADIVNPKKITPAHMEFVDIAGLVEGASKGEGLGNKFLAYIRETNAIAQVVRCFDDDKITHVKGKVDPLYDLDVINTELCLADQETLQKALQRTIKNTRSGDKVALKYKEIIERIYEHVDLGFPVRSMHLNEDEKSNISDLYLLTIKPMLYIANVEESAIDSSKWLSQLNQHAEKEGSSVLSVCAAVEAEIAALKEDEKLEFLADMGLEEPGLNRIIRAGYKLLGLETFFTAGQKEVRAWTIRKGDTAPSAAGKIHTDFEHGFIRAEAIAYEDFIACEGEGGAKDMGKWRLEGKEYIVKDGDILLFRFNV